MTSNFFTHLLRRPSADTRPANVKAPAGQKPGRVERPFASKSLIEQLPWAEPDDGVVFLRGGEKVWFGIEIHPATAAQVDFSRAQALSEGIRVMLNQSIPMTEGGRLVIERVPAPAPFVDYFLQSQSVRTTDPLLHRIVEAEREDLGQARLRGEITTTRYFLTVYVNVPKRPKNLPLTEGEYRQQMALVRKRRTNLQSRLEGLGLSPAVMSNREVKWLIWRYLNGNMVTSAPPAFTSQLDLRDVDPAELGKDRAASTLTTRYQVAETEIGTQHPGYLTMGDRLIGVVSLSKGGTSTGVHIIDNLLMSLQNKHFYVMVDFEHLQQGAVKAKLDTAVQELEGMAADPVMRAGQATLAKAERTREAIHEAEYLGKHFWRLGFTTVLYARTREELTEMLEKTRSEYALMAGAHAIISNEQLKRTFFDVLPFSRNLTLHRVSGHCANVADAFPKISPWLGSPEPNVPLRNRHGGLTGLNLKKGGTNFGVMVLGQSGGGKSVWNMNMLLNMVPQGVRGFILDPKHDYEEVTWSLGGQVIPISTTARLPDGRPVRINIFDPTPGEDQPGPEKVAFIIAVLRTLDLVPDREHQAVLEAALQQFFLMKSRRLPDPEKPGEFREVYLGGRLRDFVQVLSTLSRIGGEGIHDKPHFLHVRDRLTALLQPYVAGQGGVLGEFLDGETTVKVDAPCVTFDVYSMYNDPTLQALGILLVGEFMFQQAARTPGTKIGIFEELGVLGHIPELAHLVNRWFKTGRSLGMIPVGTSQEVKDFERLGGLINNSAWVVMAGLGEQELAKLQEVMGLSDKAAELAASVKLRPGVMGEYLVLQKIADGIHIGDVVQLWMSPEKLWTVTTHHEEKQRRTEYTRRLGSRTEAILQLAAEVRARRRSA
ncbi:VirB4 family type IV secretion system protein [Deinococcus aluminii]|uniref:TraG P-loop domain-containing protein n=1 Tax=Deinococcus aluminii TaxID=1656885 RepID=A0ABP9XEZ9_9DEIO